MTDIGDKCTECGHDTAPGSGRFVNRIPSLTETKTGYLCAECQCVECDTCHTKTLDYWIIDGGLLCEDCFDKVPDNHPDKKEYL